MATLNQKSKVKSHKSVPQKPEKQKLDIAAMTPAERVSKIRELGVQIIKTRLEIKAGRVKNTRQVFNLRKQLARVKTAQNGLKTV